jgi:hypothetical protein
VRFGVGECFGTHFSILCALRGCIARQGSALETPSSPDGFLHPADPMMGKGALGRWTYYPYYSRRSYSRLQFGDVLRRHPLQAPAYGDRGGSFEHSPVSGYDLRQLLPAPPSIYPGPRHIYSGPLAGSRRSTLIGVSMPMPTPHSVLRRLRACLVRVRVGMVLYAISYEKDISN